MSKSDNFEASASSAPTEVASFDRKGKSLVDRFQHALHTTPALVPLIVLVLSVAIFGASLGSKFFSPFALTLILQQVQIVGKSGTSCPSTSSPRRRGSTSVPE